MTPTGEMSPATTEIVICSAGVGWQQEKITNQRGG
jgi:hypothetical protein